MSQTDFRKTHPIFFEISICRSCARPISGKFIKIWMSFPEIGLVHDSEIEISKHNWINFPEIGPRTAVKFKF